MRSIVYIDLLGLNENDAKKVLLDNVKFERAKPTTPPGFPASWSVTEKPRFPGALPPVWNVPFNRNRKFTGRESLLADIRSVLASGQPVALHGLGGMGKTQIAIQYSYNHMADYQLVWWIRSEESATLASDYADLASDLDLPKIDDQRKIINAVRRWLGQNKDWLLIFDNAEKPADIRDYLPQGGNGHAIITTRDSTYWSSTATALEVKKFNRAESIEFLHKRTKQEDAAGALAEELGGLPLALEQAGAYILAKGISLGEYLELFRTRRKELWKDEKPPADYRDKVDTTWNLAMDRVKEEAPEGADLLNLCAFLAPDEIPRSLFGEGNQHLPESLTDTLAVNRAVDALRRYSLIDASPENAALSVHRLVQTETRDRLSDEERKRWAEAAVQILNDALYYDSDNYRTWSNCAVLLPHAMAVVEHTRGIKCAIEQNSRLLNNVGFYLDGRAEFHEAENVFSLALAIQEASYGPDYNNPEVAKSLKGLGNVLAQKGDLDRAKECYERALTILETIHGPDSNNHSVASIITNLGSVLYLKGDLDGAKERYERALEMYGPDYLNAVSTLIGLGLVLARKGDFDQARKHYKEALAIDTAIYGPNNPTSARIHVNLGNLMGDMGDFDGAKECYEKAIMIQEAIYGPDSNKPDVAKAHANLGNVLAQKGDLDGAKEHYEKAIAIQEAIYGPDYNHLDIAVTVDRLGNVLIKMGNLEGAKEHFERALKIRWELLGCDHPLTLKVKKKLESLNLQPQNLPNRKASR